MMSKVTFWVPFFVTLSLWFLAYIFTYQISWSGFGTTVFISTRGGSIEVTGSKWKDGRKYAPYYDFTRYSPQRDPNTEINPFSNEIWHPGIGEILRGRAFVGQEEERDRSYVTIHVPFWILSVAAMLLGITSIIVAANSKQPNTSAMESAIPAQVD